MGGKAITRALSVGTDVMRLVGSNPKRTRLEVYNNGSASVYILGSKSNTKEEGIPVAAGTRWVDKKTTAALYIVADSGTQDVRVMTSGE